MDSSAAASTSSPDSGEELAPQALPEHLRKLATELGTAREQGGEALLTAFARFREEAFRSADHIEAVGSYLVDAFHKDETTLASLVQVPELVQELAAGESELSVTVAGQWVMAQDWPRLIQFSDALLAAKKHLDSEDALTVMLAVASTMAFRRPMRAQELLSHVEHQIESGREPDQDTLLEAQQRVDLALVVASVPEADRVEWEKRLRRGQELDWADEGAQVALQQLAGCLNPTGAGAEAYRKLVPRAWWDLCVELNQLRHRDEEQRMELERLRSESSAMVAPAEEVSLRAMETSLPAEPAGQSRYQHHDSTSRFTFWQGVIAGGVIGVICWGLASVILDPPKVSPDPIRTVESPGGSGSESARQEVERLTEELRHVGNLDMLRAASWSDNASLLLGRSIELPFRSRLYRDFLMLLHWLPPTDEETRLRVPELLLERAPDGELIELWERVAQEQPEMVVPIATAAHHALNEVSAKWTATQRERLEALRKPVLPEA